MANDGEEIWPSAPTDEDLLRVAVALIDAGRATLPIQIEGLPLGLGDPRRQLTSMEANRADFVRIWLASLLQRVLDGYDATLLLREERLDLDARAHIRIAFEHLCAFAWIAAEPEDTTRPLRVGRFGMEFYERSMLELSQHYKLTETQMKELGFAVQFNESELKKPPSARQLCEELDHDWGGTLPMLEPGGAKSFSSWYSYLFRGASAFVHPTSAGIEPMLVRARGLFVIEPSRRRERKVLELCAMHLSVAIAVASLKCPDFIDEAPLQALADLRLHP